MKNYKNVFTTKRNNLRLFFQLTFFALFAIMSVFSSRRNAGFSQRGERALCNNECV